MYVGPIVLEIIARQQTVRTIWEGRMLEQKMMLEHR